jgi:PPOX class probable F420-dependent enzyme
MLRDTSELGHDMTAPPFDPHVLLAESRLGVLATIKADGRPQLSPVMPFYDPQAGVIHVSMRAGLAKTANLRRDPRATLEVTRPDGRAWATAEGTATLTGPGSDGNGPEVQALVDYYRLAAGEHPDWDEYRSAMVADRRVLMTMTVDKVYGADIGSTAIGPIDRHPAIQDQPRPGRISTTSRVLPSRYTRMSSGSCDAGDQIANCT